LSRSTDGEQRPRLEFPLGSLFPRSTSPQTQRVTSPTGEGEGVTTHSGGEGEGQIHRHCQYSAPNRRGGIRLDGVIWAFPRPCQTDPRPLNGRQCDSSACISKRGGGIVRFLSALLERRSLISSRLTGPGCSVRGWQYSPLSVHCRLSL